MECDIAHDAPARGADVDGLLIVNADDWGRDRNTTDRILDCTRRKAVSSVSAMVFMDDSERSAAIARRERIDTGLHLNFTLPFTGDGCPAALLDHQHRIGAYLRRHRLSQMVFNPALGRSFEYVVKAQVDEFRRSYGTEPGRLDGHHHMHLCANVLLTGLLPSGTVVRRSFAFRPGEKGIANRAYRRCVDRVLGRRHRLTDFFFSLAPLDPSDRLRRIVGLARHHVVEVETHPVEPDEYRFLAGGEIFRRFDDIRIAASSIPSWRRS